MGIPLIQGTISGLKFAGDIAKSILEMKTLGDVQGKVIELQSALRSAQSAALSAYSEQATMVEAIRALEEEVARVKAWDAEKVRYRLVQPWSCGVAYALTESMSNAEPPHLICANCYQSGRKSILNPINDSRGFVVYSCPVCKSQIPTGFHGSPVPDYAR